MKNMRKLLVVMAMLLLCVFATSAMAEAVLTNGWYANNLTTVYPTTLGSKVYKLNTVEAELSAASETQTHVKGMPFELTAPNADALVGVKLLRGEDGSWKLDANPLEARFRKADWAKGSEDAVAPTVDELNALITVAGLCGHDDTVVDIAAVSNVDVYGDIAVVTLDPAKVAKVLEEQYGCRHTDGNLCDAVVTWTVANDTLALDHVKVSFEIDCPESIYTVYWMSGYEGDNYPLVMLTAKYGDPTPTIDDPVRDGWLFLGWAPSINPVVKGDTWYTAQWRKIHTVTYTDGVDGEEIFPDEVYEVLDGDPTPVCTVDVSDVDGLRPGWRFKGWAPVVTDIATGDVTYVAQWVKLWTVTYFDWYDQKILAQFICEDGEPTPYVDPNDYTKGSYVNLGWTTPIAEFVTCDVTYTMMQMVPPRQNNVGGLKIKVVCLNDAKHTKTYSYSSTLALYLAPDDGTVWFDGTNYKGKVTLSTDPADMKKAVDFLIKKFNSKDGTHEFVSVSHSEFTLTFNMETKRWVSDLDLITLTAKCPDCPAITDLTHTGTIQKTKIRMENVDKVNGKTQSLASKYLLGGTYYVSPVTGSREEGGWTFTVTVSDYSPYVQMMADKYGLNYRLDEKTGTLVYTFKYAYASTGKTVVNADGSGWSWDTTGLANSVKWNGFTVWVKQIINVTYTDGVEDEVIFEDQTYTIDVDGEIPAFVGEPAREGYVFQGWSEAVDAQGNLTFTAIWEKVWNITYVGVPEGVENPNPTTYLTSETPIALADLATDGFIGWEPAFIAEGTEGDLEIAAKIIAKPTMPKLGTNVSDGLMLFQCTRCSEEHQWLNSTCISANTNRTYWNAAAKRWETFVYAKVSNINTTQVRKNYFGNYQHYYADDAQSIKYYLYYAPDVEGSTSLGNPTTGFWFAVDGNPIKIDVWCYGEPTPFTADNMPSIGNALWARDCTNTKNYNRYNNVKGDVVSISEMTKDDAGNYWITVTVSGANAVKAFQDKYGTEYTACTGEGDDGHVSAASGHGAYAGTYQFVFKYAAFSSSSIIDYSKNNWKFDQTATIALGTGYAKLNGYYIWMSRNFTVTYTDGVEGEEVFADQVFTVREKGATPTIADPVREGYVFTGWTPAIAETVTESATYTATWEKIWTITYVGVPEGVENPNPTTYLTSETPITLVDIVTDGYIGWDMPVIAEGTEGDLTITANILAKPTLPKLGTNVSDGLMLFQCTRCSEEHQWLNSTCISTNANRTYWNYDAKRWETFVYAKCSNINTTQVRKNYFGNYQHYYADDAQSIKYYLYYAPDVEGSTATGNPTTGFWFAVDGNPIKIDVWCYGEPTPFTADNMPSIGNALWARDCTNTKNYNRYNNVAGDIVSISEMTKDDAGNYWMTVTVSGANAVKAFQDKYGTEYTACTGEGDDGHVSAASGHGAYAGTYQFVFKYAAFSSSSIIDYSKNNWKFDQTATIALGTGYAKLNGYYIWMSRNFTVTYTDGVEGEEVFADQVFTVREKGATPTIADPVREGYVFTGWTPAVAATVTENVTYTATWQKVWTVTFTDGVEDEVVFEDIVMLVNDGDATPAINFMPTRDGYRFDGWTPEAAETVTEDATYTATWVKTWTVTYTDGVEDEVIFEDVTYVVDEGAAAPIYECTATREGYKFFSWTPNPTGITAVTSDVVIKAQWIELFTVTYTDGVEGEEIFPDQVFTVEAWELTPHFVGTPEREGYVFNCWNPDVDPDMTRVTANTTYTATWTKTWNVTYTDGVEDAVIFEDVVFTVKEGEAAPAYECTATREGYKFFAWTPNPAGITAVTADVTIKAQWIEVYTVTYTDGVEGEEIFPDQVYAVEAWELTPHFVGTPVREGYVFEGWNPSVNPDETRVTANATYTATWTKTWLVTFTDGLGGEVFEDTVITVKDGAEVPSIVPNTTRDGYRFAGWLRFYPEATESTDAAEAAEATETAEAAEAVEAVETTEPTEDAEPVAVVTEDMFFSAIWQKVWTVTYTDGVDGEEIFADFVMTVDEGAETPAFDFLAVREGYTFLGWAPEVAGTVTADATYTAQWQLIVYTVNFFVGNGLYDTVDVLPGDTLTLPADPTMEGHTFTGWDPEVQMVVTEDASYTAVFTPNIYTITFRADPYVTDMELAYGAPITAPEAPEKLGHVFVRWEPEVAATVTGDATYTAVYERVAYTVTFVDGDNVISTQTVLYGDAVTVPADPTKEGYTFTGWSPSVATYVVGDATYTAQWEPVKTYTVTFVSILPWWSVSFEVPYGQPTPTDKALAALPETWLLSFSGWQPEVAPTVTENATYYAVWTLPIAE